MISHKYKCIFIHIPKCAGTSIENALGHKDNITKKGRGNSQDHRSIRMIEEPLITPHLFSSTENVREVLRRTRYKKRDHRNPNNEFTVTKEQYNSYYKFTVIRDPWARAYSWYKNVIRDQHHAQNYKISEVTSFKDFLKGYAGTRKLRPQTYWLKSFDGSIKLDFVGRFENLADDFKTACKQMHLDHIELPHKLKGSCLAAFFLSSKL